MGKIRGRKSRAFRRLLGLGILFWAAGVQSQADLPLFASAECPDFRRQSLPEPVVEVTCGVLTVEEDRRADANARALQIFVAILRARDDSPGRPIIYLAGGPGDSATADIAWWLDSSLRDRHDVILVDQRGTGHSRPSLNCPEFEESADAARLSRCRDRLLAAGINLSAYNALSPLRKTSPI